MKRAATKQAGAAALLLVLAACGPVPQPFRRDDVASPLVSDPRMLGSIQVRRVRGLPGLDEAMARALADREDIIAFAGSADPTAFTLIGAIDGRSLVWTLTDADGRAVASETEPLAALPQDPATLARVAETGAAMVATALRQGDLGAAPVDVTPRVAVRNVTAPDKVESGLLAGSIASALDDQGLLQDNARPDAVVEGALTVNPSGPADDAVGVDWTVRDASGAVLGSVSQSNVVPDTDIRRNFADLAHQIAAAAAPGIADLIRQKLPKVAD